MSTSTISRSQLCDLVWSETLKRAADRFGLRRQDIINACKRACVPRPPIGYWTNLSTKRQSFGQAFHRRKMVSRTEFTSSPNFAEFEVRGPENQEFRQRIYGRLMRRSFLKTPAPNLDTSWGNKPHDHSVISCRTGTHPPPKHQ